MGVFYPQASMILRVRWEDFGDSAASNLQKVYDLPILARRVTVNINDYTQADHFDCEIDYKNFPFDPRSIRACGVTIFMQDMGGVFNPDNSLDQIVPNEQNAVFIGFADEESISFDDTKRSVKLEGRDYTGLFIDRKYPHGTINVEKPLDEVLSGILSDLEEAKNIKLDNRITEELPILGKFWGEKDKLAGKKNVAKDQTYWDVIQDIVAKAGLIAYIELDKLVLTKPRTVYDEKAAKKFIYGKNLTSLEYKRKIGRMKGFNVAVRSLSLRNKEVLLAKLPMEGTDEWSKASGIPNVEVKTKALKPDGTPVEAKDDKPANYMSFRVADVEDKDHLIKIGQEIYEELSRQQLEGSFETKEMEVPDVKDQCYDILKLRVGTPVQIEVDQGDLHGLKKQTSVSEKKRFLIARCFKPQVAQALADTMAKYKPVFYTRAVQYTMDSTNGFSCKVDFINFIELPKNLGAG